MDVSTIHQELRKGITRKFYIFTGDEWALQQIYINQITSVLKREFDGVQCKRIDSVADVIGKRSSNGFIKSHFVYTVRDKLYFVPTPTAVPDIVHHILAAAELLYSNDSV